MERPGVGVAIMLVRDGHVLLGLRKGSHGSGTWGFPGGHIEFGESIADCAKRELYEETGIDIDDVQKATFTNDVFEGEGKHYITLFVSAKVGSDVEAKLMEPEKCIKWDWFHPSDMPSPLFLPVENLLRETTIKG